MSLEFKRFPSLENTYREKEIQLVDTLGYSKEKYLVTEKVHGANFSFHVFKNSTGVIFIKTAKRSGFIDADEKFFNYRPVVDKYQDKLLKLYTDIDATTMVVYGELFGGNIQNGMCYPTEQDFVAFDVLIDNHPLDKDIAFELLCAYGVPTVPVIGIYDNLEQALQQNERFTSKLKFELFDGNEEHEEAEGLVIEPVKPKWFPSGSRIYFKKKTKRFLEKGGNKVPKPKDELPKDLEPVLLQSFEYITLPRYNNVVSKIGEVTIKDIGKVMGLFTKDVLEDMQKDGLTYPDNKCFMKLLQKHVQDFIRPILLKL